LLTKESNEFKLALRTHNIDLLRSIPKADLHNHFVMGGNRDYLMQKTGKMILPIKNKLNSMDEMHRWVSENLGSYHDRPDSATMRKLLIEATFEQARLDGIRVLEIGEDVWGLKQFFNDDIKELLHTFKELNQKFAPDTELRLQIGLSRHCGIEYLERVLDPFWGRPEFYSIDLYGDEFAQPIEKFKGIYKKAKQNGLKVKAHVGEWGTSKDIIQAIELLELDEIQHGISAIGDDYAIALIKERHIRLNMTPTSNVLLGRVDSIKAHPIRQFFEKDVDLTVNSDDILIFGSEVSQEYLSLYKEGVLGADELDFIRLNGLKKV